MSVESILSGPVGRKAVEAAADYTSNCQLGTTDLDRRRADQAIRSALAVLLDPECPDCHLGQQEESDDVLYRCPTCHGSGLNPQALVPLSEVLEELTKHLAPDHARQVAEAWRTWASERGGAA